MTDRELLQVLPASVRAVPADGQADIPGNTLPHTNSQAIEGGELRQVVEDGSIVYWPGFEAIMHYILYSQVSKIRSCAAFVQEVCSFSDAPACICS